MIGMAEIQDLAEELFESGQFADDEDFWRDKEELKKVRCGWCGANLDDPSLDLQKKYFCGEACETKHGEMLRKRGIEKQKIYRENMRQRASAENRSKQNQARADRMRNSYAEKRKKIDEAFAKKEAIEKAKRGGLTMSEYVDKLRSEREKGRCVICKKELKRGRKTVCSAHLKKWKKMLERVNYLKRKEKNNG